MGCFPCGTCSAPCKLEEIPPGIGNVEPFLLPYGATSSFLLCLHIAFARTVGTTGEGWVCGGGRWGGGGHITSTSCYDYLECMYGNPQWT